MKTISIHGKNYVPVSERIKEAGDNLVEVHTEVLQHEPVVVVKATIVIKNKGTFSGISSANPLKLIEKTNPYEVAETSAVGRALGFAGYGIDEGIASADEVTKYPEAKTTTTMVVETSMVCKKHDIQMKLNKNGKPYHIANDEFCNGYGFPGDLLKEVDAAFEGKTDEEEVNVDDIDF